MVFKYSVDHDSLNVDNRDIHKLNDGVETIFHLHRHTFCEEINF